MTRDDDRRARCAEAPIVGGLPEVPGIIAAMRLSPGLATHLRGLADELLVEEFAGATLSRAERELIATAVSAENDCFYCMDSHGAFARALFERAQAPAGAALVEAVHALRFDALPPKLAALVQIARIVRRDARDLTRADVTAALATGATDADTQLAVMIASAFSMFNRMVEGFRAPTPSSPDAYRARAAEIATHGYSSPLIAAIPK